MDLAYVVPLCSISQSYSSNRRTPTLSITLFLSFSIQCSDPSSISMMIFWSIWKWRCFHWSKGLPLITTTTTTWEDWKQAEELENGWTVRVGTKTGRMLTKINRTKPGETPFLLLRLSSDNLSFYFEVSLRWKQRTGKHFYHPGEIIPFKVRQIIQFVFLYFTNYNIKELFIKCHQSGKSSNESPIIKSNIACDIIVCNKICSFVP